MDEVATKIIEILKKHMKEPRDDISLSTQLTDLKRAAQGTENLMPNILNAVRAYASVGEISNTLRSVFGEYQERVMV